MLVLLFFFFKQKTAYEMRISDWSSDVCSSDLADLIASGLMTRLLGRASLAASAPPSAAGAGAGSAVQRATPKPVTAARAIAPATVPRRRLSLVIIFCLRC